MSLSANAPTGSGHLVALEFYSGIGGMHYALQLAAPQASVACNYDINEVANDVYKHNTGRRPHQGNIDALTPKQLDKHKADIWMLAPPCQPYTRQGLRKGHEDDRSRSFFKVLELLPSLAHQPQYVLMENVVGFETSITRAVLLEAMHKLGYATQEFVLTPLQYGVPYSRPRYFFLAKKGSFAVQSPPLAEGQPYCSTPPCTLLASLASGTPAHKQELAMAPRPIREFLVDDPRAEGVVQVKLGRPEHMNKKPKLQEDPAAAAAATAAASCLSSAEAPGSGPQEDNMVQPQQPSASTLGSGADAAAGPWHHFWVADKVLEQSGDVIDVVTPESRRCNCFTKSYSQFARGTGSLLATAWCPSNPKWTLKDTGNLYFNGGVVQAGASTSNQQHTATALSSSPGGTSCSEAGADESESMDGCRHANCMANQEPNATTGTSLGGVLRAESLAQLATEWRALKLRYFTPREVANLHSFPPEFSFPAHTTLRQRYQLLGNSLSVKVVADLLSYLLLDAKDTV